MTITPEPATQYDPTNDPPPIAALVALMARELRISTEDVYRLPVLVVLRFAEYVGRKNHAYECGVYATMSGTAPVLETPNAAPDRS